MKIEQFSMSGAIKHFKQGFIDKWNLKEYKDINAPCVFVGIYDADLPLINKHQGFKILFFTGGDIKNAYLFKGRDEIIVSDMLIFKHMIEEEVDKQLTKFHVIPIRSYDNLKPVPLGDKIYLYLRNTTNQIKDYFQYKKVEELVKIIGEEHFIFGYLGNTMDYVVEEYYKKSFLNIQLNPIAGCTSMFEMAYLGRKTISNYPGPFCLPYATINDMVNIIESERLKIGQVREDVYNEVKLHMHDNNDWLNTEYWKTL